MSTVEVPLTQGFVAIVDKSDADRVLAHKWYAQTIRRAVYASRSLRRPDGTRTTVMMHQYLTGYALTDHVNGDGLDNRRANLREATPGQNSRNMRRARNNTSGFKGVSWFKRDSKWQAHIAFAAGSRRFLGLYPTAEEAARAYDAAARELHGEYAALNFPEAGERAA